MENPKFRLRIAPSPTGNFHIGTLRTTLFNWLLAKHEAGTFILRIEDTDQTRSKPEFERNIIEEMNWLGLTPDEGPIQGGPYGPYRQSERMKLGLYTQYAIQLFAAKKAYYCFCTEAELDEERKAAEATHKPYVYSQKCRHLTPEQIQEKQAANIPHSLRFQLPSTGHCLFHDLIRGDISFDYALLSDFVIMRSDGSPSYNFAVVVDDLEMKISHVVRGEDHISNTPRQLALFEALNATPPQFAHLPMILAPDRSKLSKRHGATSVSDYRTQGFLPSALLNYLVLLGWSSPDGREIMPLADIISQFTLDRISKSGAIFDLTKLKWMNGQHLRQLQSDELFTAVSPFLNPEILAAYDLPTQHRIIYSVRDNLDLLADINSFIAVYGLTFADFKTNLTQVTFTDTDRNVITHWKTWLSTHTHPTPDQIQVGLDEVLAQTQLPKGKVFRPIRWACSGQGNGPHLPDLLSIIPTEPLIERCAHALLNH